jgi:hypothetical protein
MDGLLRRLREIKTANPDTEFCVRALLEADDIRCMQLYLRKGFAMSGVVPVMKYDLSLGYELYYTIIEMRYEI